ncbi:MAG: DegV family protein [Gammaproteobacteria bacterium]|nr:DegV family protein [Gammaproteobacteria bacterium]
MSNASLSASVTYLDGARLRRALQAGIHRVISRQEHLNKINVFPVPDGDTGTNIAFTLTAILHGLSNTMERHVGRLLAVVADSALDGARGNSGAIFAQFFQGFSDAAASYRMMTPRQFIGAVKEGALYAREALSEPREGTMITVLTDFANALEEYSDDHDNIDLMDMLDHGLLAAEASLANTPNLLPVLKKAGVVDAGAEGFVDMLRGIHEFVSDGSMKQLEEMLETIAPSEEEEDDFSHDGEDLTHRYCTECMITGEDIDRRKLREELAALGSSLVLAGSKRKAKVHIHVNEPREVFKLAESYGNVSGQKADDMLQQSREASKVGERGVAIITDSGADIPEQLMDELNIHMVPVRIHFGEKSYLDKVSMTAEELYAELESNPVHPKTSQPPPGDFRRQFQFLGSHYDAVVSINLTAKASGTWQAAETASQRADGAAVEVLDSYNVSVGQGLLVAYAAECAKAGYSAQDIVDATLLMRGKTHTWGALRDLSYAVRGGRVSAGKKKVADLLNITPVLTAKPDGAVKSGGVFFGREPFVEKFHRFISKRIDRSKTWRVFVSHCNTPKEGQQMLDLLCKSIPKVESSWLMDTGSALGVHAGPGSLVVGVQEYEAPAPKDYSGED